MIFSMQLHALLFTSIKIVFACMLIDWNFHRMMFDISYRMMTV